MRAITDAGKGRFEVDIDAHPLRLIKFETEWCPTCMGIRKTKLLEKFVEAHRNITLVLATTERNAKPGEEAVDGVVVDEKWSALANAYHVPYVPMVVIEHEKYGELASDEERPMTRKTLQEMLEEAEEALAVAIGREEWGKKYSVASGPNASQETKP